MRSLNKLDLIFATSRNNDIIGFSGCMHRNRHSPGLCSGSLWFMKWREVQINERHSSYVTCYRSVAVQMRSWLHAACLVCVYIRDRTGSCNRPEHFSPIQIGPFFTRVIFMSAVHCWSDLLARRTLPMPIWPVCLSAPMWQCFLDCFCAVFSKTCYDL